jgi:DNA-binding MarR family transcriptional regulator
LQQPADSADEAVARYAADSASHQFDRRDYTTVSRQVAKLESLGLVERQGNTADRRVREAVITSKGKAMTNLVDAARERIGRAIFATWDAHDIDELVRLMRKFADAVKDEPPVGS